MSIAVNVSPSRNEKAIETGHSETSRGISVGSIGFGSLASFFLAAVLFWAISILLGIL
jgi:hypothetical protein